MKLIILAAGDAFELDGYSKLLINHPKENKNILELYSDIFDVKDIIIVVGFKAIEIMNKYPQFTYIYNKKWQTSGSSFSLSLALDDEPCYVVSSDILLDKKTIQSISQYENCALIKYSENKRPSSINASIKNNKINSIYSGLSQNNDPELLGVYKISNSSLLKEWKRNCVINYELYAGENLPIIQNISIDTYKASDNVFEINTPEDYIHFLRKIS